MKQSANYKTLAILLVTASGTALLSGCQAGVSRYEDVKGYIFAGRPKQVVENMEERRVPVYNMQFLTENPDRPVEPTRRPVPLQELVAPTLPPPVVARAPQQPAPIMAKRVDPKPAASEASEGNFFTRLLDVDTSKSGKAERKPIPGNPYYASGTSHTAPLPKGPLKDNALLPVAKAPQEKEQVVALAHIPSTKPPVAPPKQVAPALQPVPLAKAPLATPHKLDAQHVLQVPTPIQLPKEEGSIPLVAPLSLDGESHHHTTHSPVSTAPKPTPQAQSDITPPPVSEQPKAIVHSAADEPLFVKRTQYAPQEAGDKIMISKWSDSQKKETIQSQTSQERTQESEGNFFTRLLGLSGDGSSQKVANQATQQTALAPSVPLNPDAEQPSFAAVPNRPSQFDDVRYTHQGDMSELQSDRDVAQSVKIELNSEPSGLDVATKAKPKAPSDIQPLAPLPWAQTKTVKVVKTVKAVPSAPAPQLAPSATVPADAPVMPWAKTNTVKTVRPVSAPQLLSSASTPVVAPVNETPVKAVQLNNKPAPVVIWKEGDKAVAAAKVTPQAVDPVVPEETQAASVQKEALGLPSPKILERMKMLPPSRYAVRRQAQ